MKYDIHPEYKNLNAPVFLNRFFIPIMQMATKMMFLMQKSLYGIKNSSHVIDTYKNRKLKIKIFSAADNKENMPCLLFIHGGAFILNAARNHKILICEYAKKANCKVVFIDYGLAPKYKFPYGLEDCYHAYKWIVENAENMKIDKKKIAVYGDSAGGALAAGLTQLIRDRGNQKLLFQMLIYPVIDIKQQTDSMKKYHDTPMWNSKLNKKMWEIYIGKENKDRKYASPIETENLGNLPNAFIETAQFDCLRDEGLEYADKLKENGIDVTINDTLGTIHGFEFNGIGKYSQTIIDKRIEYINEGYKLNHKSSV
jgi:acetyl esterase/lipase